MPTEIQRNEAQRLIEQGAQLLDVLHEQEYRQAHLPGAINLPLAELTAQTAARLRRDAPVVVYCEDSQ